MKIILVLFALLHAFLLVSWLNSVSQTYNFVAVDPPQAIVDRWYPHWERLVDNERNMPLRSFRIVAEDSPFDGEIITFFGLHVYLGEEGHVYFVDGHIFRGNPFSFDVVINSAHGWMFIGDMWAFGHSRAAERYYEPVIWQDARQNPVSPPDSITEEEARALRYILTAAILTFGVAPFMPYISFLGIALFIVGIINIIINHRFKKRGEARPNTFRYMIFYYIFNIIIMMHVHLLFWR